MFYYDPFWQMLYGKSDGFTTFLPMRGEAFPIKVGQLIRIEGTVSPARGIFRNEVTVTVLRENAIPAPKPVNGHLTDYLNLDGEWSSLAGYVCKQEQVDSNHILYQVLAEGWLVNVRVLLQATEPIPNLLSRRVRFDGVYVGTKDLGGNITRIDYWVPQTADVTILGELADDSRFKLPRTPLDRLPSAPRTEWVRVEGEVKEFKPGRSLTLRDETGQITVETPQPGLVKVGDRLELVGRPTGNRLTPTLKETYFQPLRDRSTNGNITGGDGSPRFILRVVQQVMELPLGEVARGYNVNLRGVVTWSDPHADFFFLQDATGGIRVRRESTDAPPPVIGMSIVLQGMTNPGRYAPEVRPHEISLMGSDSMPAARLTTLEQLLTGANEAQLVETSGYVRQVVKDSAWSRLDLTTSSGEFAAFLPADPTLDELVGAVVRIKGVCAAEANARRQLTGIQLWVGSRHSIEVVVPPSSDPFSGPRLTITGLSQFAGMATLNRRVTVTGRVLLQMPGRYLLVQEGESGLMAFTRSPKAVAPGANVEISGLPGHEGSRMVLREAITREVSGGGAVVPYPCNQVTQVNPELDARLVRLRAVLLQSVTQGQRTQLTLQADGAQFDAVLDMKVDGLLPGSLLELTGVYLLEFDEAHQPHGFRLQLRSPTDVLVLKTPSWWTTGRAFAVAGGLGLCTLLGVFWVLQLRRVVRDQTRQIRAQIEKEARMQAELERSSRLESLGVLAGGIAHDFNNLLTAIMGNLGLMRLEEQAMHLVGPLVGEAERATKRASDITQQLLTFAKGGDPVRAAVNLPEVVQEAADFVRHGSNVKVEFDIPPGLPPANVDASQISRVTHNLVLNAVQAMPDGGKVRIALTTRNLQAGEIPSLDAGCYLQLTISDNGPGISPESLQRVFDPYFSTKAKRSGLGLATAHSIVKKHKGHMEVESRLGQGATFRIWLPTANRPCVATTVAGGSVPPIASARILFMDDEKAVCQVARSILQHFGHITTVVHDGSAAVAAFTNARASDLPFDVVILDLTVPGGMGGREAAAELLRIDPTVQIIASSGYSQDPVMSNCREFGFIAALPKPYNPVLFNQVINQVRRQRN